MAKWFKKNYKYLPIGWWTKAYKALGWEQPDKWLGDYFDEHSDGEVLAQVGLGLAGGLASTGTAGTTGVGRWLNKLFGVGGTAAAASQYNSGQMDPDDPDYDEYLGATGKNSKNTGLGSLIGALLGKNLGTIIQTGAAVGTTAWQNNYNRQQAEQAYEWQNEFYNNHLSMPAKVQEYKDAGLNPMSLASAGVGATSAPNTQQAAPAVNPMELLGNILGVINQTKQTNADVARAKQETLGLKIENSYKARLAELDIAQREKDIEKTGTEIVINQETVRKVIADADFAEIIAKYQPQVLESEIGNKNADTALKGAQLNLTEAEKRECEQRIEQAENRFPKEMSMLDENIKKIQQEIKNLVAQEQLTYEQKEVAIETTNNLIKQNAKIQKEINLLQKDYEYYRWNHSKDLSGLSVRFPLKARTGEEPRFEWTDEDVIRYGLSRGVLTFDENGEIIFNGKKSKK